MASYVAQALKEVERLPTITRQVLTTIEELDGLSVTVCGAIDVLHGSDKPFDSLRSVVEDIAEKKTALAVRNYDLIDQHIKVLDKDIEILELAIKRRGGGSGSFEDNASSPRPSNSDAPAVEKKRRRYTVKGSVAVDPSEPIYCTCRRNAFGEMIACDNEDCPVEWFHYCCVGLTKKPKYQWFCSDCRV